MVYPRRMHKQGGTRLKNVRSHTEGLQGYASLYEAIYLLTALISPWFHKVVSVVAGRGGGERGGGGAARVAGAVVVVGTTTPKPRFCVLTHTHRHVQQVGYFVNSQVARLATGPRRAGVQT